MMWNSHADIRTAACGLAVLLASALAGGCVAVPASDAPAAAVAVLSAPIAAEPARPGTWSQRIQLARVEMTPVEASEAVVLRIVHPNDLAGLHAPVLITARVVRPLGDLSRTRSPMIVLNGRPLTNSIVTGKRYDEVLAVFPDRKLLKQVNRVQVGWFGDLDATLSEPLDAILAP